jgi:hypothetical protein
MPQHDSAFSLGLFYRGVIVHVCGLGSVTENRENCCHKCWDFPVIGPCGTLQISRCQGVKNSLFLFTRPNRANPKLISRILVRRTRERGQRCACRASGSMLTPSQKGKAMQRVIDRVMHAGLGKAHLFIPCITQEMSCLSPLRS